MNNSENIKTELEQEWMYEMYSIDFETLVYETGITHSEKLQGLVDQCESWGTIQAEDFAHELGMKCHTLNTYNNPDETLHLQDVYQFHVICNDDGWYYAEDCIILIEKHLGGDVRGNYGRMEAYKCKDASDFFNFVYQDEENIEPYEEYEKRVG